MANPTDRNFTPSNFFLPHREEQSPIIALQSPASIEGAFRYLLREHFKKIEPWTWNENPTASFIAIEVGDEKNVETADNKPAIFISHGQTAFNDIVLGNQGPEQPLRFKKNLKHYYTTANADISITCTSPRRTEATLLGDLVQKFFHFSNPIICAAFKFSMMSPVVLNTTRPYDKDEKHYMTPIVLRVTYELQWRTMPAAAPLNSLHVTMTTTDMGLEDVFELVSPCVTDKKL